MQKFIIKNIESILYYLWIATLLVCFFFFGKYLYNEMVGEIVDEEFVVEDKKYLPYTPNQPGEDFIIITERKEFRVEKDDYKKIEIGDVIYIRYNSKTMSVKGVAR